MSFLQSFRDFGQEVLSNGLSDVLLSKRDDLLQTTGLVTPQNNLVDASGLQPVAVPPTAPVVEPPILEEPRKKGVAGLLDSIPPEQKPFWYVAAAGVALTAVGLVVSVIKK